MNWSDFDFIYNIQYFFKKITKHTQVPNQLVPHLKLNIQTHIGLITQGGLTNLIDVSSLNLRADVNSSGASFSKWSILKNNLKSELF